jgi:hypothetical protein
MKISLSKRQRAVLEVMSKPKIPAEIRDQIGLNKGNNLSSTIKELVRKNVLYCLRPKARLGKLYGLTKKGISLRKKVGFGDYHESRGIDWYLYGWVVCGKQRKAILKAMIPDVQMTLRQIRERAMEYNSRLSRTNTYDVMQLFLKTKNVMISKNNTTLSFGLTKTGRKIRSQLLKC